MTSRGTKNLGREATATEFGQKTLSKFIPKSQLQDGIKVIIDHREAQSATVKELIKLGVVIDFRSLKVGDYVVSDEVAIERKTCSDFASSIIDRRLFEQASAMKEAYGRPLLLLEGGGQPVRGISPEAVRGALITMVLDFGVPVLRADNPQETANFIFAIARREQRDCTRGVSLKDRRRPATLDGEREYVVASLPFIESTSAKRLLETFGTVEKVFTASEEDLQKVDKIGPKKAKRIRELVAGIYPQTGGQSQPKSSYGGPGLEDHKV
ncbi:MAG: helix-hairpin-helix domain-containing protein [Candidatus Methanomethylicus sp.]|nr:helix-hairpin-helix domain-containing protein [Candidatus Methanomethylicus sp.]